jgi:hypothetical protein
MKNKSINRITRLLKLPNAFNVVFMKDKRFKHTRDVNAANIVFFERLTDIHVLYKTIDDDSKYAYSNHSVIISAGNKCLDEIFKEYAQRQEAPPPHELCFKAYTARELEVLLRQRLSTVGYKVLEDFVFEIICKKNANLRGDLRRLLASCDRAIRKHSDKNNSVPLALFKEDTRPDMDSLTSQQRVLYTFFKEDHQIPSDNYQNRSRGKVLRFQGRSVD